MFAVVQFRIVRSWTEILQWRGTKAGRPLLVSQLPQLSETQGFLPFLETTPKSIAAICRHSLCARHGAACFTHILLFNIYIIRLESNQFLFFHLTRENDYLERVTSPRSPAELGFDLRPDSRACLLIATLHCVPRGCFMKQKSSLRAGRW